jgi:hypothetical protein
MLLRAGHGAVEIEKPQIPKLRVSSQKSKRFRFCLPNTRFLLHQPVALCEKPAVPVLDTRQARRVSGSWRMAAGRRRSARSRGSEGLGRAGSRKPRSDQHQECSTTDNHGYRRLDDLAAGARAVISLAEAAGGNTAQRGHRGGHQGRQRDAAWRRGRRALCLGRPKHIPAD